MELSQRILQYIQDKGVTPYKVSKETGISESLFSMWKKKPTSKVSVKNLDLIAGYFGITVDELMGKDEPTQEPPAWVTVAGNAGTEKSKLFDLPEVTGVETTELLTMWGKLSDKNKKAVVELVRQLAGE